jgi:hypothetical protein
MTLQGELPKARGAAKPLSKLDLYLMCIFGSIRSISHKTVIVKTEEVMADPKEISPKELVAVLDKAIDGFKGQAGVLEGAIGALVIGRRFGWRPLFLMHSSATIRKYETILKLSFRDRLPEEGDLVDKSVGWTLAKKVGSFWKAVTRNTKKNLRSGEIG